MAFKIKDKKDFNAGLMFMIIGMGFVVGAKNYPMGTAVRMGPAYFPTILGWLLFFLGMITFVESFFTAGEKPRRTQWRPMGLIMGSVLVFGLLVGPLQGGVVLATLALVVISALGGDEFKWKEVLPLAAGLAVAVVATFVYGLGLPFQLFPWS